MKRLVLLFATVALAAVLSPVSPAESAANDQTPCIIDAPNGACNQNGKVGHGWIAGCTTGLDGRYQFVELSMISKGRVAMGYDAPILAHKVFFSDGYAYRVYSHFQSESANYVTFHWRAWGTDGSWIKWASATCRCPCDPGRPHHDRQPEQGRL